LRPPQWGQIRPPFPIQSGTATANLLTGPLPDKVFARTTSKATENLLTDALGSTIALAGSTGSVETSYTYDPFGTTTKEGTASENATQYAGQEDEGSGIYYDRARFYSPAAARFLSQDPTGPEGSGPNLYLYTNDSPTNAIDPYGTHLAPPAPGPAPGSSSGGTSGGGGGGGGAGGSSGGGVSGVGFGPGPGSCNTGPGGNNGSGVASKGAGLSEGGSWFQVARCSNFEGPERQIDETMNAAHEEEERGPKLCSALSLGANGMALYYGGAGLVGSLAGPEVSGPLFLLSGTSELVSGEFEAAHDITGC
jgi:RHS repeat-associated protein